MIETLAILSSIILFLLALLHLYWALGGYWPGKDEDSLARTVVGNTAGPKNQPFRMPPRGITTLVALALTISAVFPILWAGMIIPYPIHAVIVMLGMWVITAIFILRGVLGMLPLFDRFSPAEPFRTLNRKFYSPLCLLIGGFLGTLIYMATH